jgi:hypothetical protein
MSSCYLVVVLIFLLGLNGCGSKQNSGVVGSRNMKVEDVQRFEQQIDELVEKVVATQYGTKGEFAPVAVIPGAIKQGIPYTHLEEVVAKTTTSTPFILKEDILSTSSETV